MRITEEASGIVLDLLDHEAIARINTSGGVDDTRLEGSRHAAGAATGNLGVVSDGEWVGEGDAWRA